MTEHFICIDCGQSYICSYSEQRWFLDRNWSVPKRCKACRAARKREDDLGMRSVVGPDEGWRPTQADRPGQPPRRSRPPEGRARQMGGYSPVPQPQPGLLAGLWRFIRHLFGGQ